MKGEWILKEVYFQDGWPCVIRDPINKWKGLTYQEIVELQNSRDWTTCWSDVTYTRAVEAKLKEKNNG
jgi:hypothetical protein